MRRSVVRAHPAVRVGTRLIAGIAGRIVGLRFQRLGELEIGCPDLWDRNLRRGHGCRYGQPQKARAPFLLRLGPMRLHDVVTRQVWPEFLCDSSRYDSSERRVLA